jgi:hypothetical protein
MPCVIFALAVAAAPQDAAAQEPSPAPSPLDLSGPIAQAAAASAVNELGPVPDYRSPGCPGCPERHSLRAIGEAIGINFAINWFDRATHAEPDQFYTDPESWWDNLTNGFVFDDNNFSTNQFAHPYHGSTYFNAGRSNGLSYWESAPLAALGSFTWECCGEKHPPSFNDFIATTLGGIAVGEVLHRVGNLVRSNRATGKSRIWREAAGFIVNPVTGANRLTNGDAYQVREDPGDRRPDYLGGQLDVGNLWRGAGGSLEQADSGFFAELVLIYGDPFRTRAQKPFDYFRMTARFGGLDKKISQFNLRGRLFGGRDSIEPARSMFMVTQGFGYITNPAYELGGQAIDGQYGLYRQLSPKTELIVTTTLSFIPLGSISAEHVDVNERTYDMGVGTGTELRATLRHRGYAVAQFNYQLTFLHTVNGSGAEHLAQFIQGRVGYVLFGRFGIGAAAALYLRNSYYTDFADTFQKHPEARAFVTMRLH